MRRIKKAQFVETKRSEVKRLKEYTKVVLYAYPLLKTIGEDYEEHIRTSALLSYRNNKTAEEMAEYLAMEIVHKQRLEWLKHILELVMARLSDVERTMLEIRYFGKRKKIREFVRKKSDGQDKARAGLWSERVYFRRQQRLLEKVQAMLQEAGLTKQVFEEEFALIDIFAKVQGVVAKAKGGQITEGERKWLKN